MCICTFAGHSSIVSLTAEKRLREEIEAFLSDADEAIFYVGGRGDFDAMAASAVRAAKAAHRDKKIQLYLIEPYLHSGLNRDRDYGEKRYDGIIIPQELIGAHPKAAIRQRNRWMVDQAELLIAYVYREYGGAYEMLKYARRKENIRIVNLANDIHA